MQNAKYKVRAASILLFHDHQNNFFKSCVFRNYYNANFITFH